MYKTWALILRRRDLRERDKLLTIYTPSHGKVVVRAVGAKKIDSKLGGHLEPFMLSEVCVVPSRSIDILAGAQVQESFSQLRSQVPGLHAAQYLMEVVEKLTPEAQADPRIFELLTDGLRTLNQQSTLNFLTVQALVIQLLSLLGFQPQLDNCSVCNQPTNHQVAEFLADHGGMTHVECIQFPNQGLVVDTATLKALRFVVQSPLSKVASLRVSTRVWQQLNECVDSLLGVHTASPVKSRVFLGQLI